MLTATVLSLLGCAVVARPLAAQSGPDLSPNPSFLTRLLHDYSAQSQFLLRNARNHPKGFLLGTLGVTALVVTDKTTGGFLQPQGRFESAGDIKDAAATLSELGDTRSAIPLALGFGAVGLLTGSTREKETATLLAEALITSGTWTALIKAASGRERPRELDGEVADWTGPGSVFSDERTAGERFRSFPSGHATGAWAAATILANQYPRYGVVPIVAYTSAGAISYSRIALGAHWLSDVVVGGLIGYGCAKQVFSSHRGVHDMADEPSWRIGLDAGTDYQGVNVTVDF